jgi:hypothetical protein
LPLPLAAADGHGVEQGAAAGGIEQPRQLGIIEGAAGAAAVGFLVRPDDAAERVEGKPTVLNAPVGEGDGGGEVGVPGPARHPFRSASDKPALDGRRVEVGQPAETAIVGKPLQLPADFVQVFRRHAGRFQVQDVGAEVFRQGRRLVVADGGFGRGHHP